MVLTSRFFTVVVPFDRAAKRRMRFDRDLEPGSFTWPSILSMGCSVSCSR